MSWAERLSATPIPALRETHSRLSRLVGRDDTSNWQVEDILRRDPVLAMLILGEVNRQARRFGRDEVATFDSAIALLGRERLKSLTRNAPEIALSMLDPLAKSGIRVVVGRAIEAAQQAENWAHLLREAVPEQHFHAAALAHMPEIALWHIAPEQAAAAYTLAAASDISLADAFSKTLGEDWNEICAATVTPWGLPSILRGMWSAKGVPTRATQAIKLAGKLLETAIHGWNSPQCQALRPQIAELLDVHEAQSWAECQRTAIRGANGLMALGLVPSAHTIPASTRDPWPFEAPLGPQAIPKNQSIAQLRTELSGIQGSNALVQHLLKRLRADLGLSRLVLMMLNGDKNMLETRFAVGLSKDDPLRSLILPLRPDDLFNALLKKHQPLWLHAANRATFLARLPEASRKELGEADSFIAPLKIRGEFVGLLLAQREADAPAPSSDDFRLFNDMLITAHQFLNPPPAH